LSLFRNQIGDGGISSIASAIASGALPSLRFLSFVVDAVGLTIDPEHPQLTAACESRRIRFS
jgi:hypothetical protein